MKVRYTPRAFADRELIFDYLEKRSPAAAREMHAFIDTQVNTLATLPERHPVVKELGESALARPLSLSRLLPNPAGRSGHPAYSPRYARRPWTGGE
jgi:plasmid stabilization system protein ParE